MAQKKRQAGASKKKPQTVEPVQKKKRSDRERIKNITGEIHPEYAAAERPVRSRAQGSVSDERSDRQAQAAAHAKRIKKIRRRRRGGRVLRFLAILLVLCAIGATGWVIRGVNNGSMHDSKGMTAYEDGDLEAAVSEFREAMAYDENNADYYIHLGMTYVEMKSYDLALGVFNEAEGCASTENQLVLVQRGRGIVLLSQGSYEAAAQAFANALDYEISSSELRKDILYYKAEAEEKSGNYEAAAGSYGEIIKITDDASARMLRGMAYVEAGNYEAAESDLYKAISMSRKSYAIYKALYKALMAQGKEAEAEEVLTEALDLAGTTGEDYFIRGLIYMLLGDLDNAQDCLNKSNNKGYAPALLGLGELAVMQESYPSARVYYENFFSGSDLSSVDTSLLAKGYNGYARVLIETGEYEAAVLAANQGLAYGDRETTQALKFNLIAAYEGMADWENAYLQAKSYVESYPEDEAGQQEFAFLESRL